MIVIHFWSACVWLTTYFGGTYEKKKRNGKIQKKHQKCCYNTCSCIHLSLSTLSVSHLIYSLSRPTNYYFPFWYFSSSCWISRILFYFIFLLFVLKIKPFVGREWAGFCNYRARSPFFSRFSFVWEKSHFSNKKGQKAWHCIGNGVAKGKPVWDIVSTFWHKEKRFYTSRGFVAYFFYFSFV